MRHAAVLTLGLGLLAGCGAPPDGTFGKDVAFLKEHTDVMVLSGPEGEARVAIVPAWQGRVMTSSFDGDRGLSLGWVHYDHIASGKLIPHMNAFGGEDRFWMGPEGGQFAIYFKPGSKFIFADWQTPAVIDSEPYDVVSKSDREVSFRKAAELTNYSGTKFDLRIDRTVRLLDREQAAGKLGTPIDPSVQAVVYESDNQITNTGKEAWKKDTGLLSIWILGMYVPTPKTTVVIPFVPGPEETLGPKANDEYFGKVPADRLTVKDSVLFFRCDGTHRSKIGLSPRRAKPIAGSYDAANRVLTLVQLTKPEGVTDYVNSMWELQKDPYGGDTVNSYNDGPPAPGEKPMGPFYEIESSSPAAALAPGESIRHVHRTFHLHGSEAALDAVARKALGVGLAEIKSAFARPSAAP